MFNWTHIFGIPDPRPWGDMKNVANLCKLLDAVPQKVADDDGHRQRQRWRKQSKGPGGKGPATRSQWPAPRNSRAPKQKTQQNKLPAKARQGQKQCTMKTLVKVETNANGKGEIGEKGKM